MSEIECLVCPKRKKSRGKWETTDYMDNTDGRVPWIRGLSVIRGGLDLTADHADSAEKTPGRIRAIRVIRGRNLPQAAYD